MNHRWYRVLSALLCVQMLLSCAPVFSEESPAAVQTISIEEIAGPAEAPAEAAAEEAPAGETAAEAPVSEEPAAEASPAPTAEPTAEAVAEATAAPTAEPTTPESTAVSTPEATAEPTAAPTAEPTIAPTAEPSAAPSLSPVPSEEPLGDAMAMSAEALSAVVDEWLDELNDKKYTEEYDKAFWLYKRLISEVTPDNSKDASETAEAALIGGKAGSLGFAYAYETLLDGCGIASVIFHETADKNEAWNVVRLDGRWSHIDAFADACSGSTGKRFGLTDSAMARYHNWSGGSYGCTSPETNYFVREKNYTACGDLEELFDALYYAAEEKTTQIRFYWYGDPAKASLTLATRLLSSIVPSAEVAGEEDGCYAVLRLNYEGSDVNPDPTDAPTEPEEIVPAADEITIGVGEERSIADFKLLPEGTTAEVRYSSASTRYLSVTDEGVITGNKAGSTSVTIKTDNGLSCRIQVEIKKAPTKISSFVAERVELYTGETTATSYKLNSGAGGGVSYSSSDESVATVDANGVITAVGAGKAKITLTTYNGISKSGTVTIKAGPETLELSQSEITLGQGDSWQLEYAFNKGAEGSVTFTSSDEEVASVSEKGVISALQSGVAIITVESFNGLRASCTVTVAKAPEDVALDAERTVLGVGEELTLTTRIQPEDAFGTLKFSADSSRAEVDENGVVTAKRTGDVTITAKTYNGKKTSVELTIKKAPKSITLEAEQDSLQVGQSMQFKVKLSSDSAGAYTLVSSDESKLTIDENGLATALSGGEVKIAAETYNGKRDVITLKITAEPEYIKLSESYFSIGAQDSWQLDYSMNEGAGGEVVFTSSNEKVATVDQDGTISALKEGFTVITATAYNGVQAQCIVTVVPAPEGVEFTQQRTTFGKGEEFTLEARMLPEGVLGSLEFESDNTRVLTVDGAGMIKAVRTGTAAITVKTYNGKTASIELTVVPEPESVNFTSDHSSMGVGEIAHLSAVLSSGSAGSCIFTSSDESILTIDSEGNATAHAVGKVEVTVTAYNGVEKSRYITVSNPPESIRLSHETVSIGAQDSWQLDYTLDEGAGGCVRFSSSNESVATVDANGMITTLAEGFSVITARTYNGLEARCLVLVVPAPDAVTLSAPRTELGVGESLQLTAETLPDGAVGTLEYASSNSKYIEVDANGVVTAKRTGTATIAVKTYNGKTASIKLTVVKAPKSISISTERTTLGVGESVQLSASIPEGYAGSYSFVSEDESLLTIDANGLATAHGAGEVTVTAVTYNGVKKSGKLTILEAPSMLFISPAAISVGAGDTASLSVTMNEGAAGAITYISADPAIAAVDASTGVITGVSAGVTRITATAYNGRSASAQVTVLPQPTYIHVPYGILEVGKDDTIQLTPEVDPGCSTTFSYTSSNSKYATVDENGLVTGKRVGSAKITIATSNGLELVLSVKVREKPDSVTLTSEEFTIGVGERLLPGYELSEDSAGSVHYEVEDTDIAAIDESGAIVGLKKGSTRIAVETYNGKRAIGNLTVVAAPKSITAEALTPIAVGQQTPITATLKPSNSHASLSYEVIEGDAVRVDANGIITGVKEGSATIRVSTHVEDVDDSFKITVKPAPESIELDQEEYEVLIDETLRLKPILSPNDCVTQLTYEVERAGFFTVDEEGLITPIMRGSTRVKVSTHNGLYAIATIHIVDPFFPEKLEFIDVPPEYLEVGDGYTPIIGVYPESAVAALEWTSSDKKIATVDAETGKIIAVSHGTVTIEAVSARNPALMLSYKLVVLSPERCLKMPNARTDTSKISTTLSQIKQVRSSAYRELESIYTRGEISKSEYDTRKSIIERAFSMYLFPWMTDEVEPYWSAANSEGGAKDYKPDIVYYGLPYTQTNRRHNVSSAVNKGYYYDTGKGYYKMDNSTFSDRNYAGNDCSSFASMAVWGTGKSHSYDSTRDIGVTTVYDTLNNWKELRPGDLLNSYNHHVVVFLYYANEAKTQIVIIEQGGGDGVTTNTVSCSIRNVSYYTGKGYNIKRLASLS